MLRTCMRSQLQMTIKYTTQLLFIPVIVLNKNQLYLIVNERRCKLRIVHAIRT
jgi:hypothetical protein